MTPTAPCSPEVELNVLRTLTAKGTHISDQNHEFIHSFNTPFNKCHFAWRASLGDPEHISLDTTTQPAGKQ